MCMCWTLFPLPTVCGPYSRLFKAKIKRKWTNAICVPTDMLAINLTALARRTEVTKRIIAINKDIWNNRMYVECGISLSKEELEHRLSVLIISECRRRRLSTSSARAMGDPLYLVVIEGWYWDWVLARFDTYLIRSYLIENHDTSLGTTRVVSTKCSFFC